MRQFSCQSDSRIVSYDRKAFIRLAPGVNKAEMYCYLVVHLSNRRCLIH